MVNLDDIYQAIAKVLHNAQPAFKIATNPLSTVEGECFLIKKIESSMERESIYNADRELSFDVVYLPKRGADVMACEALMEGIKAAFLQPLEFNGRFVSAKNMRTHQQGDDYHLMFDIDFFDDIEQEQHYKLMQNLNMRMKLEKE